MNFLSRLFRTAFRNKGLTLINIFGLGAGLAVALFLLVYLHFEFSFDKHFQEGDRIYRVLSVWKEGDGATNYPINFGVLASTLKKEVPEVETASRLYTLGDINLRYENGEKASVKTYMVDSSFLQIFSFKTLYGNQEGALDEPNTCVITRSTADRFFGVGSNPVGKSLFYDDYKVSLEVKAVIEDVPLNTHFRFDLLTKLPEFGFGGLEYYTYLKFRPGVDDAAAVEKCNKINENLLNERFANFNSKFGSITEPLSVIHTATQSSFDLSPTASKSNLIFIVVVTIFILAIALSNFISLSIIQGEKRATEISVRKTNGAERSSVMKMLFGETTLVTLLAFVLAIVLYYAFSHTFARVINFNLPEEVGVTGTMWAYFIGLFLVVTLIAGGYPAYYLSRFSPIELIRKTVARKYKLTATSVVIQFSVVIFCISALFVVWRQLDFMKKMPLGFDADNVLTVQGSNMDVKQYESLRSDFLQHPVVTDIAISQGHPLSGCSGQGLRRTDQSEREAITIDERRTGPGYFRVYGIPILEGRELKYDNKIDSASIVLTETTVTALGLQDPIGKKVLFNGMPMTVVGVAHDIHYGSAREKIGKLVYTAYSPSFWMMGIKYQPGKFQEAKTALNEVMEKHFQGVPYSVATMRDFVNNQYWQDEVTSRILMSGTLLAIILALLGLVALMGFVAHQKRKEISVRRVMGAQVGTIIYDLNRYVLLRILPAVPIGIGLSYFAMYRWLQNFAYTTGLSWWIFAGALALTFVIVLLTILYQSIHSATANPVDALKSE